MEIGSIRCCVDNTNTPAHEEPTTASIIFNITAVAVGVIAILIGILTLYNLQFLQGLGTSGGLSFTVIGFAIFSLGMCLECTKKAPLKQQAAPVPNAIQLLQDQVNEAEEIRQMLAEENAIIEEKIMRLAETLRQNQEETTQNLRQLAEQLEQLREEAMEWLEEDITQQG